MTQYIGSLICKPCPLIVLVPCPQTHADLCACIKFEFHLVIGLLRATPIMPSSCENTAAGVYKVRASVTSYTCTKSLDFFEKFVKNIYSMLINCFNSGAHNIVWGRVSNQQ